MNTDKRNWLVIALVLLNLALAGFIFFMHRHGPPRPGDMPAMWQKELQLTDAQRDEFDSIQQEHRRLVAPMQEAQMENRKALLRAAATAVYDSTQVTALSAESARLHQQMDAELVKFYQQLRTACTPEQQQRMTDIFMKTLRNAGPPPPRK
ncbi:MAG: periplasmic heavy metal sensor [Lewinellaceae bacterium]|nr:periplasmic heavy metal sensor [Lewinellaceae bacterium]